MNPKDTQWSAFDDGIGDPAHDTSIQFIGFNEDQDNSNELNCYSEDKIK